MTGEGNKTGVLWKYLKAAKAYRCPADVGPFDVNAQPSRMLTSYLMNGETCANSSSTIPFKAQMFGTRAAIFLETREDQSVWNDGANYASEGIPNRHGKAGSVGNIDGSVDWIPQTIVEKAGQGANRPNRFYCNPANAGQGWKPVD
ncbi:MAG: hypothetical protein QM770_04890 [Tepidisphaeraceae bacterium]